VTTRRFGSFAAMRTTLALVLAVLATAASAGAQSSDGTITIATLDRPGPVSGYGENTFAWSAYDPETGRFALQVALRGTTGAAAVEQRDVPFDVDLGPGPNGAPVAVYSRCANEPPLGQAIPDYTLGTGCDIYRYDLAAGKEERVSAVSTSRGSEVLPSIFGTRIAFARGRSVYVRETHSGGRDQRRTGPRAGGTPTGQDLRGTLLATTWKTSTGHEIRLTGADAAARLVARTRSGRVRRPLLSPSFDSGILFFRSTCLNGTAACSERYWSFRPASASTASARVNRDIAWTVHTSRQTFSVKGSDSAGGVICESTCAFIAERPLRFRIAKPLR